MKYFWREIPAPRGFPQTSVEFLEFNLFSLNIMTFFNNFRANLLVNNSDTQQFLIKIV